jgi:hypothetical protein
MKLTKKTFYQLIVTNVIDALHVLILQLVNLHLIPILLLIYLFCINKYLVLLSSTQPIYERVFSKLKLIKSKLRSTINQEHITPLMLMNFEKDIEIDIKYIINCIANSFDT